MSELAQPVAVPLWWVLAVSVVAVYALLASCWGPRHAAGSVLLIVSANTLAALVFPAHSWLVDALAATPLDGSPRWAYCAAVFAVFVAGAVGAGLLSGKETRP
jgi:hypothetical protein